VKAISRGKITALTIAKMIIMISQTNLVFDFYGMINLLGKLASSSSA
jgi:hypothetical protein